MENNMAIEYPMFCYQCEQTAGGKGCTKMGVCGKTPEVAALQDLLIYQIKGISCYAKELVEKGENVDKDIVSFIENSLFTTLTNVNFDFVIRIPEVDSLISPILSVVPLQLLAYYISKAKGLDVDKPRNLAKSVTVE